MSAQAQAIKERRARDMNLLSLYIDKKRNFNATLIPLFSLKTSSKGPSMGVWLLDTVTSILSTCSRHVSRAARKLRPLGGLSPATVLSGRSAVVPGLSSKKRIGHMKKGSGVRKRKFSDEVEDDHEEVAEDGLWRKTILMGEKCQPLDFSGVIYYDAEGRRLSEIPTPRSPLRSPLPSFAMKIPVTVAYDGKAGYA